MSARVPLLGAADLNQSSISQETIVPLDTPVGPWSGGIDRSATVTATATITNSSGNETMHGPNKMLNLLRYKLRQVMHSNCVQKLVPRKDLGAYRPSTRDATLHQWLCYHLPFVGSLALIFVFSQLPGFLAFCVAIFWFFSLFLIAIHMLEANLIYAPDEPQTARYLIDSPASYGFTVWEHVELKPDGLSGPSVTGYLLLQPDLVTRQNAPTVLFFHGNAGNIGYRLPLCRLFARSVLSNVFIIDYRGYGRSGGRPSEAGLAADAQSALDFIYSRSDLNSAKVVVFGRSLGAAVATELVTRPGNHGRIRAMIIENTFTSLPEVAASLFSRMSIPLTKIVPLWMYSNLYPTLARFERYMREYRVHAPAGDNYLPMLFLVGESDTLIPPVMIKKIASAYIDHKYPDASADFRAGLSPEQFLQHAEILDGLVRFQNGNHNDTWLQPGWREVIVKFFKNFD